METGFTKATPKPLLVSVRNGAAMLGVCENTIHNMLAAGELSRVKVRSRTMLRVDELEAKAGLPKAG